MKKIYFFLIASALLLSSCDYNPGVSEAFTKYRFKDGVTTITVPGWVIHLAARFGDLEENERDLLESIDKVRVLSIDNDALNARVNLHAEFENQINRHNDFETLMTTKSDDEDVTIFAKMNDNVIHEMVVLVGGDDNALIYIRGRIDPELINKNINLSNPDRFFSLKF